MQHCGKHDVMFPEGGSCWCCKQEESKDQKKEEKSAPVPVATGGK